MTILINEIKYIKLGSHDSPVRIETGYWLDGQGSNPGRDKVFSSQQRSDRLWDPLNLLLIVYRELG